MNRYKPFVGGYGAFRMEEEEAGAWVKFEDYARLKADHDSLLAAFRHTHEKGEGDTCAKCGLDLRNPIHKRAGQ